jgi:hypothetical protein
MANKVISTRIKNRFDELSEWEKSGVELLPGEIALVHVNVEQTDEATGKVVKVPAVLMKVGDYKRNDSGEYVTTNGEKTIATFSELPWLSAQAADVYAWAKTENVEDVQVSVIKSGSTATKQSLRAWLKEVYDKGVTNASNVEENARAIAELKGNSTGSVADAITAALGQLDFADASATAGSASTSAGKFVTVVTQTNGQIAVTKRVIAEIDLPDISASKISVDASTKLNAKLVSIDSSLESHEAEVAKLSDITGTNAKVGATIDSKITAALDNLDFNTPTTTVTETADTFIESVTQVNGKITEVSRKKLPTASTSVAGITKLGATDGAAAHVAVFGANGLSSKVEKNASDIEDIRTAIAGGVHFIGTTTTDVTTATNKTSQNVTINSKTVAANQGDIVIYRTREFIWTGSVWEELGDVTRIGNLETKIADLDYSEVKDEAPTDHKFVTKVTQTDGKIAVTYAQPSSADISHSGSTVNATLVNHAGRLEAVEEKLEGVGDTVINSINTAINNLDSTCTTTGNYVTDVSQTNGVVTVTKGDLPTASTSSAGIVSLSSAIDSELETVAATPKAVKAAYGVGTDAQSRVETVESDYVRFASGKLYVGTLGNEVIIFDCGGASAT